MSEHLTAWSRERHFGLHGRSGSPKFRTHNKCDWSGTLHATLSGMLDDRSYGSKYDRNLSTTEIAKLVRADIKSAIKSGSLPNMKVSVRSEYYSMGTSLYVKVKEIIGRDLDIYNAERLLSDSKNEPNFGVPWMSDEARAILNTLEGIVGAYNHDGSDLQTDHFDVKFYAHVDFHYEFEAASRARQLAALKSAEAASLVSEMAPANDMDMTDEEDARLEAKNAAERAEITRDDLLDSCPASWAHDPGQSCCMCEGGA
jgi:hypothetical protein